MKADGGKLHIDVVEICNFIVDDCPLFVMQKYALVRTILKFQIFKLSIDTRWKMPYTKSIVLYEILNFLVEIAFI